MAGLQNCQPPSLLYESRFCAQVKRQHADEAPMPVCAPSLPPAEKFSLAATPVFDASGATALLQRAPLFMTSIAWDGARLYQSPASQRCAPGVARCCCQKISICEA